MKPSAIRAGEMYETPSGKFTMVVEEIAGGMVFYECPELNKRCQCPLPEFADRAVKRVPVEAIPS